MLSEFIGRNKILLHQRAGDWQEAIKLAAQPLLKENYIISDYVSAMINSVKKYGPYIVIAKGVALAHARSEDGVNSMGLSVMTVKEPVDFGNPENDPVCIVFCLAAPDPTTHIDIMRSLVNIINEEWKIQQLCDADDIEKFVELLNKFEVNN